MNKDYIIYFASFADRDRMIFSVIGAGVLSANTWTKKNIDKYEVKYLHPEGGNRTQKLNYIQIFSNSFLKRNLIGLKNHTTFQSFYNPRKRTIYLNDTENDWLGDAVEIDQRGFAEILYHEINCLVRNYVDHSLYWVGNSTGLACKDILRKTEQSTPS